METLPALVDVNGPCCKTCPYSWAPQDGMLYCRRWPPVGAKVPMPISSLPKGQQLMLPPEAQKSGMVMVDSSSFPAIRPELVCGEHPDFDIGEDEENPPTH